MTYRLKPEEVERAAELLREGKLVAFPTETVYGLGASIFNPEAIKEIFRVKGRPADNPLIAHVCNFSQIEQIAIELSPRFFRLAKQFFPGPLTLVVKKHARVTDIVSAGRDTIALRMPQNPIAMGLIAELGEPIVAPSANLSGKPSATHFEHVLEDFDGEIAAVIEGEQCALGIESTVLSLLRDPPVLLRPGAITKQMLEDVLDSPIQLADAHTPVAAPGMKYRHYSPNTPIELFYTSQALCLAAQRERRPMILSLQGEVAGCLGEHFVLSPRSLYALFRLADKENYSAILILYDELQAADPALQNRMILSINGAHRPFSKRVLLGKNCF